MASRATTVAELGERLSRFRTEEGIRVAEAFRPRPTDVLIATYAKAGTTWMQQIVHGLRTMGDMDYSEVTEVTPWIEMAHDMGLDLDADHRGEPRAFKTHWRGDQAPAGMRAIVIFRDPKDTAVSFYNFMNGWFAEPGAIGLDDFIEYLICRDHMAGHYWAHLLSWWPRLGREDTLTLTFEDMKEDLESAVRRVAGFIGYGGDEARIDIATRQSTFEFMKAHERHFDDHLIVRARNAACGLPEWAGTSKLGEGKTGAGKAELSDKAHGLMDKMWAKIVEPELGFADYQALRQAVRDALPPVGAATRGGAEQSAAE